MGPQNGLAVLVRCPTGHPYWGLSRRHYVGSARSPRTVGGIFAGRDASPIRRRLRAWRGVTTARLPSCTTATPGSSSRSRCAFCRIAQTPKTSCRRCSRRSGRRQAVTTPTRGAVAAWMLTMARSRAIDRLRSRSSRPETASDARVVEDVPDATARQDLQLLSAEQVESLQGALNELPVGAARGARARILRGAHSRGNRRPAVRAARHGEDADSPGRDQAARIAGAVTTNDGRRSETTSARSWSRRSFKDSRRRCRRWILRPSCVRAC